MPAPATILIVEDDPEIRQLVGNLMRSEGFDVEAAEDARQMDEILSRRRPDLVVLDLMLPGEDGLSVCRRLRAHDNLPILMLTAKSDEIDRVVGLEMGADDYLVKPFGPRELLARVRAVLRRGGSTPAASAKRAVLLRTVSPSIWTLVKSSTTQQRPIALTAAEFDLLACFIRIRVAC